MNESIGIKKENIKVGTFALFAFFMMVAWLTGFISDLEALFLMKWGAIFLVFSLVAAAVLAIALIIILKLKEEK